MHFKSSIYTNLLLSTLMWIMTVVTVAAADNIKQIADKRLQKECRQTIKRLQKEHYEVWSSTSSLDAIITNYYAEIDRKGAKAFIVEGRGEAQTAAVAVRRAANSASVQYAQMQQVDVNATINTTINNAHATDATTETTMAQSAQTTTQQHVRQFRPAVTLIRQTKNGQYEALQWYIVDNE